MSGRCSIRELKLCFCEAKRLKISQPALHSFEGHWITRWLLDKANTSQRKAMYGVAPTNLRCWDLANTCSGVPSTAGKEWQPFNLRQGAPFQMLLQLSHGWKKPLFHITCTAAWPLQCRGKQPAVSMSACSKGSKGSKGMSPAGCRPWHTCQARSTPMLPYGC